MITLDEKSKMNRALVEVLSRCFYINEGKVYWGFKDDVPLREIFDEEIEKEFLEYLEDFNYEDNNYEAKE